MPLTPGTTIGCSSVAATIGDGGTGQMRVGRLGLWCPDIGCRKETAPAEPEGRVGQDALHALVGERSRDAETATDVPSGASFDISDVHRVVVQHLEGQGPADNPPVVGKDGEIVPRGDQHDRLCAHLSLDELSATDVVDRKRRST